MIRTIWIAATVSLVLAIPGLAQRGGGGGGGGRGGGGGGMGGGYGMARTDKSDVIAKELKLTKEQTTDVDAIFDAAQKEATPLVPKLREGRVAITEAGLKGAPPDDAVKTLAAVNAQVLKIELDAIAKVMAKLDDKQKPKSGKLFDMVDGMFQAQGGWRRSN
jgi:Spy/CpxP family protein refolding chaperone